MIYLDHHATSPLLPEVRAAMEPWWGVPANPASAHRAGQRAAMAVDRAREEVARLVGGVPEGVVFTSGATEANHAWFHAARAAGASRVAVSAVEHPCVHAATAGFPDVVPIPVDACGTAVLDGLPGDLDGVSLMAVNHETGAIQPVDALRTRSGWLHVDASAAAGRVPLDLGHADAVVLSAHKLGGPVGIGALVLRHGGPLAPLLGGGSQERGRRAGTVNVAGAVGFAHAARLALDELDARRARWTTQKERLVRALTSVGARRPAEAGRLGCSPSVVLAVFDGIPADVLVMALDLRGICVSAGAACASGSAEPSPVLRAMGDPSPRSGLRVSLGPRTTDAEVDAFVAALPAVVSALR